MQKPDFFFRRNGRVHLNQRGVSVQSTAGSRVVHISGSNAGYTMFRGSVKITGYPLHSPVSPSLSLPSVTVCHHISTGLSSRTCHKMTIQYGACVLHGEVTNGTNTHSEYIILIAFILQLFIVSTSPCHYSPLMGILFPIFEASRSHSDTPHSVGLLSTRDQPVAETST